MEPVKSAPNRKIAASIIVGFILALLAMGLPMIGVTVNLWLGAFVLLGAFLLFAYGILGAETAKHWSKVSRVNTLWVLGLIYFGFVGFQIYSQYQKDHPRVATTPSLQTNGINPPVTPGPAAGSDKPSGNEDVGLNDTPKHPLPPKEQNEEILNLQLEYNRLHPDRDPNVLTVAGANWINAQLKKRGRDASVWFPQKTAKPNATLTANGANVGITGIKVIPPEGGNGIVATGPYSYVGGNQVQVDNSTAGSKQKQIMPKDKPVPAPPQR
jgi:hypothetical protein